MGDSSRLLVVEDLSVEVNGSLLLAGISLCLQKGETVGLVGESGSGKSMTAKAILGLIPGVTGRIDYKGHNLLDASEQEMEKVRGKEIALICQNPMTALNPTLTVGAQLIEAIKAHDNISKAAASQRGKALFAKVGLPDPAGSIFRYPGEFSGGMLQRIIIAMALACRPSLLIADEPTTSLDMTTQAQIIELLMRLQREEQMAVLLITHDLGLVAGHCRKAYILRRGSIVDYGTTEEIFYTTENSYTKELCWSCR